MKTLTADSALQEKTLEAFEALFQDAWHSKMMKKLKPFDLSICRDFLSKNGHLPRGEFEFKTARLFLDSPMKPILWTTIIEVISAAHFKIHGFPKKKKPDWIHPLDREE